MDGLFQFMHILAACVHVTACIVVFSYFVQDKFPLDFSLTRNGAVAIPEFQNATCDGRRYVRNEFRDWASCVRDSWNGTVSYEVKNVVGPWSGGIAILIIFFSLVTALFHLRCAFTVKTYVDNLDMENQPLRWIEYSITYTVMTVCIFQLNEVRGLYTFLLLVMSSFAQMLIGLAIEALRRKQRPPGVGLIGQIKEAYREFRKDIYNDMVVIALLEFCACLIMLFHFLIVWDSFRAAFQPYLDSDAGDLYLELVLYIIILNAVIYFLYLGFPIVHACVFFRHGQRNAYIYGEFAYVILSLTSKISLVAIVILGAQRQRD